MLNALIVLSVAVCVRAAAPSPRQEDPTSCPPGETLCGTICVNLLTDPWSCGACDAYCAYYGNQCRNGTCGCEDGLEFCGDVCPKLQTDGYHCGKCFNECGPAASCVDGQCVPIPVGCQGDTTQCYVMDDYGEFQGVCVDLQRDLEHCGDCNAKCDDGGVCTNGKCICPSGLQSCKDVFSSNYICPDFNQDLYHCGACGVQCKEGETCVGGKCSGCPTGNIACFVDGKSTCIDPQTDKNNCGTCRHQCSEDATCSGAKCQCDAAGKVSCGAMFPTCTYLDNDVFNCGECGISCWNERCQGGKCVPCAPGLTGCGYNCINVANDNNHCGTCYNHCNEGSNCVNGTCAGNNEGCGPGQTNCVGNCYNTQNDNTHCGGCWQSCDPGKNCVDGQCR